MTEPEIWTFLESFLTEDLRWCGEVKGSYDAGLGIARYHYVCAISFPQRFAGTRLDEAQRSSNELQEEREIEGTPTMETVLF